MRVFSRATAWVAVIFFAITGAAAQQSKSSDVSAGLKDVGMAALPVFLDAATESITLKLPAAMGGGTLKFGGTIDAEALTQKKFVFTTSDEHKLSWNNAFGMPFLDLTEVAMNLKIEKGAFAISLDGKLGGAFRNGHLPRAVVIDLAVVN